MVTLSLMSIQIIDGFIAPLGIDVVIVFLVWIFPWFFKLIQNNRHVMHLNLIYTTILWVRSPLLLLSLMVMVSLSLSYWGREVYQYIVLITLWFGFHKKFRVLKEYIDLI